MLKPSPKNFGTSVVRSHKSIGVRVAVFLEQLKRLRGEEQWGQFGVTFGLFCLGKCLGRDYNRILIGHGFAWYREGATLQKMRYRVIKREYFRARRICNSLLYTFSVQLI